MMTIIQSWLDQKFYIVHAASQQNAVSNNVNGWESVDGAIDFCERNGWTIAEIKYI